MASSKASRTPGTTVFEKCTLVKEIGGVNCGLLPIPYTRFTRVIAPGNVETEFSGTLPFSYKFISQFDIASTQTYAYWTVSTHGSLILSRDAGKATIDSIGTWGAPEIIPEDKTIFLSPWFAYTSTPGSGADWPLTNSYKSGVWYLETDTAYGPATIWRFYLTNELQTDVLEYEIVLYASGRIEYRYEALPQFATSLNSEIGAAIGIWYLNHTFRDFLVEYTPERSSYQYGGAVYTSGYADTEYGVPYYSSARSGTHWPGGYSRRARFIFEPQHLLDRRTARRKSIERHNLPTTSRGTRVGTSLFNDAVTPIFGTSTTLSFPVGVSRGYGYGSPTHFQSVKNGAYSGDITTSGSVIPESIGHIYNRVEIEDAPDPFNETLILEPGSSFYSSFTSGSNYDGADLRGSYSNKTVLQKDFLIQEITAFPLTSSCMAIFSPLSGSFSYSQRELGNVLANGISNVNADWAGFSPFGYYVASGTAAPPNLHGAATTISDSSQALSLVSDSSRYDKMIGVNASYRPLPHHTWDLDVLGPYMMEALEISLPIAAGPSWFRDLTSATSVTNGIQNPPEYGGPALTYSIWRVRNADSIDLVHSGTITHSDDAGLQKIVYGPRAASDDYYYELKGFKYFGGAPSGVVSPLTGVSGPYFTGSAHAISKTTVTSGLFLGVSYQYDVTFLPGITGFFGSDKIGTTLPLDSAGLVSAPLYVSTITPFTKCATSASVPDARHPLTSGPNYFSPVDGTNLVRNPVTSSAFVSYLSDNLGSTITAIQGPVVCNMTKTQESPYLVLPGDKFVLYVSKCHPALTGTRYGDKGLFYEISGGVGHDFCIITGSLSLRFYGSYVRAGKEYVL